MPVAVYGQLGRLLRERSLTVDDLARESEERFGLTADPLELQRLAASDALGTIDLTLLGAVADILGTELGELVVVEATPLSPAATPPMSLLTEQQDQRLRELLDLQGERDLKEEEQRELEVLVYEEYGRRSSDYFRRQEAQRRGVSLEQVQREEGERVADAMKYLAWLDADPRRRRELVRRVTAQRASAST